jgi:hypothetical protein
MKKCFVSLAIKEMQIKTTLRFHPTPVRISIAEYHQQMLGEHREKEPSHTAGRNVR